MFKQHIHKKLNNKEMSELSNEKELLNEKDKIELSNNVSNKEALKDKIHNYLRNNGAGYYNMNIVFKLLFDNFFLDQTKI